MTTYSTRPGTRADLIVCRAAVTGGGMFFPGILEGASAERSVHLREPARMHDELFPHLAIDAIDRTPQRTVCGSVCAHCAIVSFVIALRHLIGRAGPKRRREKMA